MSRAERLFVAALFVALGACTKPAPAIVDAGPANVISSIDAAVDAAPVVQARDAEVDSGGPWSYDCEGSYADPKSGKPIGHTSVVFKLDLANGKKAVFKPHSKKGPNRYKGEVAAFRLAGLLGLPNVVPACARSIPKQKLEAAFASRPEAASLFAEQAIVENDVVRGALIMWVEGLAFVELDKEPLASQFKSWLKKGQTIPPDKIDGLARETSAMLVFDYVTGNWDRFSGGNVGADAAKVMLLFIDNDGAFFESPPKEGLARNKHLLAGMDRFPRGLIQRLRSIDEERLTTAFGIDSDGKPLLSTSVISGVMKRTKEVLAHVDAKIALHGEPEILYFR